MVMFIMVFLKFFFLVFHVLVFHMLMFLMLMLMMGRLVLNLVRLMQDYTLRGHRMTVGTVLGTFLRARAYGGQDGGDDEDLGKQVIFVND